MKFGYTDAEEPYLRDRRDAVARPGTNLLVGMLLSAAAATAVALLPRELSFGERAYATKGFEPGSMKIAESSSCPPMGLRTAARMPEAPVPGGDAQKPLG